MTTSIRFPDGMQERLKKLAKQHHRTLHSEIIQACDAWIERNQVINPKLVQVIASEVEQSRSEGMSEDDVKWMAAGAAIRVGREQGIIGEAVSDEMNAAIVAVVKQELKK